MTKASPLVVALFPQRLPAQRSSHRRRQTRQSERPGQLLRDVRPLLPAALPGLPSAGQGPGRLRHDQPRRPAQEGRQRQARRRRPASPTRACSSSRSCRHGRQAAAHAQGKPPLHRRRGRASIKQLDRRRAPRTTRPPPTALVVDADHPPGLRAAAGHHRAGLLARRQAAGRVRLSRSAAAQGRRLRAGRPAGRPVGAHPVAGLLARRQAAGRRRRLAGPLRRGAGLGRGHARSSKLSLPVTFDTLYGVSWSPDGSKIAFGCARQHACGPSTPRPASRCSSRGRTTTGCSTPSSRARATHLVSVSRDCR